MLRSGQSCSMPRLWAYRNVLFHKSYISTASHQHYFVGMVHMKISAVWFLFLFYFNPLSNCFTQHFFLSECGVADLIRIHWQNFKEQKCKGECKKKKKAQFLTTSQHALHSTCMLPNVQFRLDFDLIKHGSFVLSLLMS